ncbi:bifunctional riboflavin kinase/FAD synthetase [Lactococcus hircilactis]|uniref:Riboflavin biosynthesis protein n=1 Tax=Lactococcus hircilactis TaxID=1494462 RepID=A0A7X2CZY3_9LACT|nr:bifunctional riboflavin kinase/FAD synthetase [Lactococcus hircilactis]MQW39129.1 bifunctional riboflavin kinase/FAD synthetase [Lactococcus hircilactis]
MEILEFDEMTAFDEQSVLVLGYFDGLHRGHQALFAQARKVAAVLNLKIVVLTFPEKPSLTFQKYEPEMLLKLTSDQKRAALFADNGVDYLIFKNMTSSFSKLTTTEFSKKIISKFNPKVVITGFDHKTGSDMKPLESTKEYKVIRVPEVSQDGQKISSTRIRNAIHQGEIKHANDLLGYAYETTGLVVHGFARGRQLGYPTANLVIKDYIHIPSAGVYTVDVLIQGMRHRGFASIGYNETFDVKEKTIEVHVFDFDLDIYGENLTVFWLDKIRDMIKFDGMESLIAQMKADEVLARAYQ